MSNGQEKQRFSARVKTETLDKIETYQEANNLETRSNAIEVLVDEHHAAQNSSEKWERYAERAETASVFAITLSLTAVFSALALLLLGELSPVFTVLLSIGIGAGAFGTVAQLAERKFNDWAESTPRDADSEVNA